MSKQTEGARKVEHTTLWQCLAGELAGTFLLTFTAAGADVVEYLSAGTIGHVARYVAPALAVMAMIWSLSGLSGAHINPAVTLAFFVRRSFAIGRVPGYILAQLIGATAAAYVLRGLFSDAIEQGITKPTPPFSEVQAFGMETVLTFILVYVILATADQKAVVGKNSAIAVGGVVALCGLGFSPVSGASMNPARSIGPMIASLKFDYLWIYIAGPLIGAAIACVVVRLLYGPPKESEAETAQGGIK